LHREVTAGRSRHPSSANRPCAAASRRAIAGFALAQVFIGRPDFNLLQNFRSTESRVVYYAFDILIHKQRDLTDLPLSERRTILKNLIEPGEHVALSEVSDRSASEC
jgi:ATP-dependent DNA ligase